MLIENVNCVHSLQFDCFIHVVLLEASEKPFQEVDDVPVYFFLVLHNLKSSHQPASWLRGFFFFS